MASDQNEFYIGWQPEAPDGVARRVRQFVLAACVVVAAVSALLVLNQNGFATSTFEFGQATEMEGVLTKTPAPFLQVFRGKDVEGKPVFQNILLVAPGKHGATEMLLAREKQLGHTLEGRMVRLRGFLIYYDGKTLMEIEDLADVMEKGAAEVVPPLPVKMGGGALVGEITDPKCYFGVMKPGEGKPHRSCAARCIAGGIPPVLKTVAADGRTQHFLLAGGQGEPVNQEVLPFVGGQVQVCGSIFKMGDWLVVFKDAGKDPRFVAGSESGKIPLCR